MNVYDECPACEQDHAALHPMGEGWLACNICEVLYDPGANEVIPDEDTLNVPHDILQAYDEFCEGW